METGLCRSILQLPRGGEENHLDFRSAVLSVSLSSDGQSILASCGDGGVRLWQMQECLQSGGNVAVKPMLVREVGDKF